MIIPNNKKILVTTGLQETWGKGFDEIVFLGAWCRSYSNKGFMKSSQSKTVKYHWSNRTKLRNDYSYLETLFERCLLELASSLNNYHNKNYSSPPIYLTSSSVPACRRTGGATV